MKKLISTLGLMVIFSFSIFAQDATVSIPNTTAIAGSEILIPLNITGLNNVGTVALRVNYDMSVLTYLGVENSVLQGSLVDDDNGTIRINWFSLTAINLTDKILDLKFTYKGGTGNFEFVESNKITDNNSIPYDVTFVGGTISENLATLELTAPNGDESWEVGSSNNITWTSSGIDNVKLEYSLDDGANWLVVIASTPASTGSFSWTIPDTPSELCKARISDATNSSLFDVSNSVFSIIEAPAVGLTSPNGGESWEVATTQNITWTSINVDNVKLEFSADNGLNWTVIIDSTPASAGSFSWTVPDSPSETCKVKVSSVVDGNVADESDAVFSITAIPAVELTAPNGGEVWEVATAQSITWTSINVENVKLEYSIDDGANWSVVIASTPASAGSYSWTIPDTPSESCKVKISQWN